MLGFGRQRKSFSSKTRKHSNTSPEIKNEILPSLEQEQQQQQGRGGVQDDNIKPPHFAVTTHGRKDSSSPSSSSSSSGPSSNSNCSSENSSLYEANSLPKNPPSAAAAVFGQAPGMITSALNNISFNPIPTTSGKCSKLKINVFLDSTIYVAGGNLHGRLELVSSVCGSLLRIGEIAIELCGYEEITDKQLASCQSFLSARIMFQGPNVPPSNAVYGPANQGYWAVNKGKTTFPFAFRIPADAPSSFKFQTLAKLKYVVTGVANFKYKGRTDTLFKSKDAFVVESWNNAPLPPPLPTKATGYKRSLFGGSGQVELQVALKKSVYTSGNELYAELRVKNDSKCKVQGIKLGVSRRLLMLKPDGDLKVVTEPISEKMYREKSFQYDPGEERSNVLNIMLPSNIRSVRNTALSEVGCFVSVNLNMGLFSRDIYIELPIIVCNSASLDPPKEIDIASNIHPFQYNVWNEARMDPALYKPIRRRSPTDMELFSDIEQRSRSFDVRREKPVRAKIVITDSSKIQGEVVAGSRKLPWSEDTESSFDLDARFETAATRSRFGSIDLGTTRGVTTRPVRQALPFHSAPAFARAAEEQNNDISFTNANHSRIERASNLSWMDEISQEPSIYIPATERSRKLAKSSKLFYEGLSAELSVIPDEMYSYNDQFTFREQFPRAALDEEIISDTPEILMPEHLSTVVKAAPPPPPSPPFQPTVSNPEEKAESSSSTSSSANNSFISTLASFAKQMSSYGLEDRPKKSSRKKKAEGVRGGDGGIGCQKDLFVKKIPDSSSSTSSPAHPPATKSTPSTTSSSKPKLVVKSPTSVDDKILNKPLPPTKAVSSKNKDYSSSSIAKVSSSKLKSGNGVELNDDKSTTRSSVRSRRSEDKENRFSSKIGKVPMVKEKRSLPVLASFSAQQQDNDSSFYTSKSVMMHPPTLSRSLPTPPVSQPNDVPCKPQSNSSSRVQQTSAVTTSQSSKVELPPRLADLISRYSNNISSVNAWAGS